MGCRWCGTKPTETYRKHSFSIHCANCAPIHDCIHEAPYSVTLSYEASASLCMPDHSLSILFASEANEQSSVIGIGHDRAIRGIGFTARSSGALAQLYVLLMFCPQVSATFRTSLSQL